MIEPLLAMEDLEEWENDSPSSYHEFYTMVNIPKVSDEVVVSQIAQILHGLSSDNRNINIDKSIFNSTKIPSITLHKYFLRILQYSIVSRECYLISLIYLDRYTTSRENCCLTPYNIHKLIITSILCAAKFLDDFRYNNADMAKIGGMTVQEMNGLEEEF